MVSAGAKAAPFVETFDSAASSARFAVTSVTSTGGNGFPETYAEFGFDYSGIGASRLTTPIPAAPGGGSMKGLLLAANVNGGAPSSINFYPILTGLGLPIDGDTGLPVIDVDYRMEFDFWAGVNNSNSGTSEFLQLGAQSDGDGEHLNGFVDASPDSDFLEVNINGDLGSSDYIPFTTDAGVPVLAAAGFIPNTAPGPVAAFPNPPYSAQAAGGAPGEAWATAEVAHIAGVTTMSFNGVEIVSIAGDFANTNGVDGLPWFGYTDFFGSQAGGESLDVATGEDFDPFNASFVIIDNVRVVLIPEPGSLAVAMLGLPLLARRSTRCR
ncbi:MAG: hypothetical protein AAF078_10635 [Planctomycetota bacterium]